MPLARGCAGCSSDSKDDKSGESKKPLSGVRGALKKVFSFSRPGRKEASVSFAQSSPVVEVEEVTPLDGESLTTTLQQQLLLQQQSQQRPKKEGVVDEVVTVDGKEQTGRMAVFRKFLSATKSKMKSNNIKVEGNATEAQADDEEFEHRKQEWQEELDQMSDFLILKSTEEQREEGVDNPLDTAYIEDRDGLPMLKACFDVQYFKPEEIQINVEEGFLTLFAQSLEEKTVAVFKKTMIRKLEIPRYVDHKMMHCSLSEDKKVLSVEMPFHLPPQKRPVGPTVVPVLNDPEGRRKIRLSFDIGPDFAQDDVSVKLDGGRCLIVEASYEAEIGLYGSQVTKRQFYKKFRLPDFIQVETVEHNLTDKGQLFVDLILEDTSRFKVKVTTEVIETENAGGRGNDGVEEEEEEEEEEEVHGEEDEEDEDENSDSREKSKAKHDSDDCTSSLQHTSQPSKSDSNSSGDYGDKDGGKDGDLENASEA